MSMLKKISKYWWCQIIGWSALIAISMFFVTTFGKPTKEYFFSLLCTCIIGVVVTHIMRLNIAFLKVLEKPLNKQIIYFVVLTFIFSILLGIISETVDYLVGYHPTRVQELSRAKRMLLSSLLQT